MTPVDTQTTWGVDFFIQPYLNQKKYQVRPLTCQNLVLTIKNSPPLNPIRERVGESLFSPGGWPYFKIRPQTR